MKQGRGSLLSIFARIDSVLMQHKNISRFVLFCFVVRNPVSECLMASTIWKSREKEKKKAQLQELIDNDHNDPDLLLDDQAASDVLLLQLPHHSRPPDRRIPIPDLLMSPEAGARTGEQQQTMSPRVQQSPPSPSSPPANPNDENDDSGSIILTPP